MIGIQIQEPVAGVAIGLVTKLTDDGMITDHRILTDILVRICINKKAMLNAIRSTCSF
jgi:hypothetical protein